MGVVPTAPELRFWPKVQKTESCWLWLAATAKAYGVFWDGKRQVYAHRWSYEQAKGPIPPGLTIDHLCRTPLCIRPDHLEVVSLRTNILRGTAPAAEAARRETCSQGHPYTPENLKIDPRGHRRCRICHRQSVLDSQKRYPEKAAKRSRDYRARKLAG